jgi:branched-chain amino acid transport system substrate-binding protein
MRSLATAAAVLAALGAAVAACGDSNSSSSSKAASAPAAKNVATSSEPFRLLMICPFSGPLAVAGAAEKAGAQAAVDQVNAEGGIVGHKVELTTMDDAGTGQKAVTAVQKALASGTKYNAVMGGCFGDDSIPVASALAKTDIPDFGPLPDSLLVPPKYPNAFIPGSSISAPELGLATAMKAKGITKFAIITGDDATGKLGAEALTNAAKQLGMTVTSKQFVPDTSVDATSQMQAAIASKPQALASNTFTPVIGPILKARTKLGVKLPLWGDAYFSAANLGAMTTKADREGVWLTTFPFLVDGTEAQKSPEWQAFATRVKKYDPEPKISLYAHLSGWDVVMMMRAAAKKANAITGSAVQQALENISQSSQVQGFVGPKLLYKPDAHIWDVQPNDYTSVPAGASSGGIIQSGT